MFASARKRGDATAIPTNALFGMALDHRGILWIGTYDSGLLRFDPETEEFRQYDHDPADQGSLPDNRVLAVCEGDSGVLWVGTWGGGLTTFDIEEESFRHHRPALGSSGELESNIVRTLHRDKNGNLWVGTLGGGLSRLDQATGQVTTYRHSPSRPSTLGDDMVVSIYEDAGDVLWFGTGNGLSLHSPYSRKFTLFAHRPDDPNSLSGRSVFALCCDSSGVLWVGTKDGGLNRIDPKTGKVRHFRHDPSDSTSLSSNYVSAIMASADGSLWVGTWGGGVNVMGRGSESFQRLRAASQSGIPIPNDFISCLAEDQHGTIWIGLWSSGLVALRRETGTVDHYVHDPDDETSLPDNEVRCAYVDRAGQLWVGTVRGGLSRFDPREESFAVVGLHGGIPADLGPDYVQAIRQDRRGRMWIGTFGDGLLSFDPATGSSVRYTRREGLPNDIVYAVLEDTGGDLWLSTNHGICQFDPDHGVVRNYDKSDGLQSNEFNYNAFCEGKDGTLYFGGINGVNIVDPAKIEIHEQVPRIQLTSFKVFDREWASPVAPFALDTVVLSYDENFFSFEFAALDYTSPPDNRYAYRLEGVDEDWVQTEGTRFARYTDIDPGTYRFRVKGTNHDGVWNNSGVDLAVLITPPFWATWWFRALIVASLLAGVIAAYRLRVARLLQMERMRLRIASDLHDDIGSNLGSIAFLADLTRQRLDEATKESQQLKQISGVARATADALREIVWIINPEHDRFENLASKLREIAGTALGGFDVKFSVAEQQNAVHLPMEFRRQVILAFKEMLTNAARHSGASTVTISLVWEAQKLCVRVGDDGNGFRPQGAHSGTGLASLRRRARLLGGEFRLDTEMGRGTTATFCARIP